MQARSHGLGELASTFLTCPLRAGEGCIQQQADISEREQLGLRRLNAITVDTLPLEPNPALQSSMAVRRHEQRA